MCSNTQKSEGELSHEGLGKLQMLRELRTDKKSEIWLEEDLEERD